jgi:hypothetical protein
MKIAISNALVLASLVLAAPEFAESSVRYARFATAATSCQPISGTPTYTAVGSVRNDSTTAALVVDCPIGYLTTGDNHGAGNIWAWAVARANGQPVSCTFALEEPYAFDFYEVTATTTPSTLVGKAYLSAELGMFGLFTVAPMHAKCTLPVKGSNGAASLLGFETQGE